MENPSSLEQNLNDLSRLMVDLKHTKDQVAIRGKWDMVAWLKNVSVRESQVHEIMKESDEKTTGFFLKKLHTKDVLYSKLIESLMDVKVLIEEGNAGSESIPVQLSSLEKNQLKLFSYEDLKKITDFNKKLGVGGYSTVYQGEFEGEQVAVKVLKENDVVYETFLTERITMGRIFNKNLVKLHGFCFDNDIKALVYEYMENGSLDKILYKNPNTEEWAKLYDIALGIARGLAYLHHGCSEQIIHHDVKAANVLLDKNLSPKITDFGVSNLMKIDETHITNTRLRGTRGYAAPEINLAIYPITCKCDVYSYGVMLFEILGRRCSIPIKDKIYFPKEVSEMWKKQPEKIMEYCGIMEEDREKAKIVLMVAMWCVQHTPPLRPSMSDVVEVLEKKMSVATPPDPFLSHDPFGSSMLPKPSQQKILVNDKRWWVDMRRYSRMDLEEFTSGFSSSNTIGTGGYGKMYRGELSNGLQVAIKLFAHDFGIGKKKFMNEVILMSKLHHSNIVETYGYCFDKNMIALVYEYMPGGSLDKILDEKHPGIEWGWLYIIVLQIANGLFYLHNCCGEPIIHLDIMPSNILFDSNLFSKIKNVGLAESIASDVYHLTFRGTRGYAAPEVWMRRSDVPVTSKANVYSFGMIMFDVLGMRRKNQQSERWFPLQVWEKFETGKIEELIEACGITRENREDAKTLSKIALWCIQFAPEQRPSMRIVVDMLVMKIPISPPPKPFPDFVGIDENGYIYDNEDDYKKREESESLLNLYVEKCPPGGENSVVLYTTTNTRMKRSFKESNDVRAILQSHQIIMIERDVWEDICNCDVHFGDDCWRGDELNHVMGERQIPPVLFVKGRLIGEAVEVKRLEAEGKLKVLLYGIVNSDNGYIYKKREESESLLKLYEEKCPPGGENSVVIYTTTIERMRRSFKESNDVRTILQSHQIVMIERDVYGDRDYEDELNDVLGKVQIPVLFVKGRLIGAADEVKRLEAEGKLKVLLYGIPTEYSEAKKSSEQMLELFKEMCPPGGENAAIIYTTTDARMKRSFEDSNEVRAILQSHDIEMIERDAWGDMDYGHELIHLLGKIQIPPVLFVKGRLIGAADDVKRLEASGELKVLLYGL